MVFIATVSLWLIATTSTVCVSAQEKDDAALLPFHVPIRVVKQGHSQQGQEGGCSAHTEALRTNITQEIRGVIRDVVAHSDSNSLSYHCPCGGPGEWNRVAFLNMSDPTQQCPSNWNLVSTPVRSCGRSSNRARSCDSVIYSSGGHSYQQVCGRIIGYQVGRTEAFSNSVSSNRDGIDGAYIDGVSLTHSSSRSGSRHHIWSFVAAARETSSSDSNASEDDSRDDDSNSSDDDSSDSSDDSNSSEDDDNTNSESDSSALCPCTNANSNWPYETPSYVGNDYFCDMGNHGSATNIRTFYEDDPLWDGAGCSGGSSCCEFNTPPWFCKTMPQPTTDDIEIRLCFSRSKSRQDTPIQLIEIYAK